MSQHITGNVGQAVSHEDGPFIRINKTRLRQSLIKTYSIGLHPNYKDPETGEEGDTWGMIVGHGNQNIFIPFSSKEEAEKEVEKLDWLFKKHYSGE